MNILLVNDDSVYAPGIIALANALKDEHKVTIIAPAKQMSGTSHSITFYSFLNYEKLDIVDGVDSYIVNGTPCDCTKFGMDVIMKREFPDLVISGINKGYNIGTDILYSGTVNAATEGAVFKIKSIAVSQNYDLKSFDFTANFIKKNLDKLMDIIPNEEHIALSINVPTDDPKLLKGAKIATVGLQRYNDYYVYVENKGYHIMGEPLADIGNDEYTDVELIKDNYISISFVKHEFNDYTAFEKNKDLRFELWIA